MLTSQILHKPNPLDQHHLTLVGIHVLIVAQIQIHACKSKYKAFGSGSFL